jgi:hypothetical protein
MFLIKMQTQLVNGQGNLLYSSGTLSLYVSLEPYLMFSVSVCQLFAFSKHNRFIPLIYSEEKYHICFDQKCMPPNSLVGMSVLVGLLTLSNPIFLPPTYSPALIYFGWERGWWVTCNYPTVLKEKNRKSTTCAICWLKSVLHEEKHREQENHNVGRGPA